MQDAVTDQKNWINKGSVKAVAKYAMLPGIIPRIRALGFHFGHFAYLLALVFSSARLIPATHPVLNYANIGRFGVRQVIAMAANNLTWSWKNTDQVAIFSAIVIGMIMIVIQAFLICFYALLGGEAQAQGIPPTTSFFTTPTENVSTDVVLIFLDQVFGANLEVFGASSQPLGTPVFLGLQSILGFYSMATMVIAVLIVLYYILTVIGEAAKTGTPFGQRFNSLWAPIRLVVALGLLVPLSSGLNSAQYLTLTVAKMGSGLATGMWSEFAVKMTAANDIVSKPESHSTTSLISRIFLSEVCMAGYNQIEETNGRKIKILQYIGNESKVPNFSSPESMITLAKDSGMGFVGISWTRKNENEFVRDHSCGHIMVNLTEYDLYKGGNLADRDQSGMWNFFFGPDVADKIGAIHTGIKQQYISEIGRIAKAVRPAAEAIAEHGISINPKAGLGKQETLTKAKITEVLKLAAEETYKNIDARIQSSYEDMTKSDYAKSDSYDEMVNRGWGAAGLWYGNLTKINQKYAEAISESVPTLGSVLDAPDIANPGRGDIGGFGYTFGVMRSGIIGAAQSELEAALLLAREQYIPTILQSVPQSSPLYADARHEAHAQGEDGLAFALIWLIGGSDIYNLKNDPNLDPMARIAGAGHTMVTRSIICFTIASVGTVAGLVASAVTALIPFAGTVPAAVMAAISVIAGPLAGLFFALAGIGLVAGVFLAYIIPLLPFIYFMFAIMGWVLEIFEAVIAMPLWALAHLRIDGDGMPGQAAIGGYQLLLMILIRPALIVLGLIGGYVIFGAAMYFFSTLFNSAITITQHDVAGEDVGGIAVFIYTLIFAFLTYNIAIMCFKMIDDVPKGIMRWMGASVTPFSDSRGDPISGTREVVIGAVAGASAIGSGLRSAKDGYAKNKASGGGAGNGGGDQGGGGGSKGKGSGSASGGFQGKSPEGHSFTFGNAYKGTGKSNSTPKKGK